MNHVYTPSGGFGGYSVIQQSEEDPLLYIHAGFFGSQEAASEYCEWKNLKDAVQSQKREKKKEEPSADH